MIVLDTHVWLWWIEGTGRLSRPAQSAIDAADLIGICSISCWEVMMLARKGKIELDRPPQQWVEHSLSLPGVMPLPVSVKAAVNAESGMFDSETDPADRIIAAPTVEHDASLVTHDERLTETPHVQTIW